ncbi:MAG: hypothetical protein HC910_21880 [Spirulinaceae cyanobacterium SM2_1_0]|nr:hypothetical protein [Spirulinaceae cyanobacterium SM2_1_0]
MAAAPVFTATPNVTGTAFANADSTNYKTIFTPGASGSRVHAILVTSNDPVEHYMTFAIEQSSVQYVLGTAYVAAKPSSVFSHTSANILDPAVWTWLNINDIAIVLPAGTLLKLKMDVAVSAAKAADIVALGGDY